MAERERYHIQAVLKAGSVLEVIAGEKTPIGSAEVATRTGLSTNEAFRLCVTLAGIGFLTQIGDRYELGMALATLWARKKATLEGNRARIDEDLSKIGA